jgi:hypothetical protein
VGFLTLPDAATARTYLGLGTMATQNANAVAITGGDIDGVRLGFTTPITWLSTSSASVNTTPAALFSRVGAVPQQLFSKFAGVQLSGGTSNNLPPGYVSFTIDMANANAGGNGMLEFVGTRSTYAQVLTSTRAALVNGDQPGFIIWGGDDGTSLRVRGADIFGTVDTTLDPVSLNSMPIKLDIRTAKRTPITLQTNNTVRMTVGAAGTVIFATDIVPSATGTVDIGAAALGIDQFFTDFTNTATVGAVVINKMAGRVNVAIGAVAIVVTNNKVTAASHVIAVVSQNDATCVVKNVVTAAGSFTINLVAATAQTSIDFIVFNV